MEETWNLQPMIGSAREYQPLKHVIVNGRSEEWLWDEIVRRWHYLGYKKTIGQRIKYLVYWQEMLLGAISFNRASLHVGVRDRWLEWDEETRRKLLPHVVNNDRFLILPWIRVKNLASHILSQSLRLLARDWFQLYGYHPYLVETFVDLARHQGICYKGANWLYLGETRGYSKVGKAFVYHGNRKGVFVYLLNRKLLAEIARNPRQPFPKQERVRLGDMMLSKPDWSPSLFAEVGLNEKSVAALGSLLGEYMDYYRPCFSWTAQQRNAQTYIKGLLSDLDRKSVEPIALRYQDEKAVRTLQQFQKDAPWDDVQMKRLYQARVLGAFSDPEGMLTIDGSDFVKKGTHSAGVARQYCGRLGKVENCQAGVFIGYAGKDGYGLLDCALYLPKAWFDELHEDRRQKCDIPGDATFRTKPQLALDMIAQIQTLHPLPFRWVGCDAAFGCDAGFRASLPECSYFFADIRSNQHVFLVRPEWSIPERTSSRGRAPSIARASEEPKPVAALATDESIPWKEVIMEGSKGPVRAQVKCCRVIESVDGVDGEELWLYIRKYENGEVKYAFSNAPVDTEERLLHRCATLRWPIEQCFQECKGYLGMSDYETRSFTAWHRHMLLVMVAFLFVLEVRQLFQKKRSWRTQARFNHATSIEAHPRRFHTGCCFNQENHANS